jgi:hypothetical protein
VVGRRDEVIRPEPVQTRACAGESMPIRAATVAWKCAHWAMSSWSQSARARSHTGQHETASDDRHRPPGRGGSDEAGRETGVSPQVRHLDSLTKITINDSNAW